MDSFDVIIIGAGLGGLISGAKLSKEGKKVLVLEQHSVIGGCATIFKRKDFLFEAGLHAIDGLDKGDPKCQIFKELGIFDHVEFVRIPEFYRFKNPRVDIVVPFGRKEAIKLLVSKFPDEEKGIKKFFRRICNIQKETSRFLKEKRSLKFIMAVFPFVYPYLIFNSLRTLGKFLDSNINNEDLKLILQANLQYYHDDPYSMSMIYFSAGQASYYNGGGHYIKGGSRRLSDYLSSFIQNNGGEIRMNHRVDKIIMEENKACGVECVKKSDTDQKMLIIRAEKIIVNAAIPTLINILPEEHSLLIKNRISKMEVACSLLSVYIGFRSELKHKGSNHYSTIVFDGNVASLIHMKQNFKGSHKTKNFVFVDFSRIDSELAPEGKSAGVICAVDYLGDWDKLDNEEYRQKKNEVAEIYISRLDELIPGIKEEIEYYEVSTPRTIKRFTLNPEGSVYGFAQTPKQTGLYRFQSRSHLNNLYYASAWANPGGGFTGAILSGWFCAGEVLKK